jgi:hypothetical protein
MMKEKTFRSTLVSGTWSLSVLAMLAAGCASTRTVEVEIPPRVDLRSSTIGLIGFTAVPADKLSQTTTQRFMAAIQAAQPGVRFLELGTMDPLLRAVGRERIDPETIQIIGKRYKVDSVFTGSYEISEAKPKVSLDRDTLRAAASVHISMAARLWDTKDGATVWTNSRNGDWPVAQLRVESGQPVSVSLSDPEERYGDFMRQLVRAVTEDFRPRYEKRRVAR